MPIDTAPKDEIVILGWWFRMLGSGASWEIDIDVPHSGATHWLSIDSLPTPPVDKQP